MHFAIDATTERTPLPRQGVIRGPATRQADLPFTVSAPKANEPAPVNANKM